MISRRASLLALLLFLSPVPARATDAPPWKVKVVVITTFEVGKDSGDMAGEFQNWFERESLTTRYPLPAAYHDAYGNDRGVLAFVTGGGTAHAAASVMALGNDPRFDFSKAYWLLAGIAARGFPARDEPAHGVELRQPAARHDGGGKPEAGERG